MLIPIAANPAAPVSLKSTTPNVRSPDIAHNVFTQLIHLNLIVY